MTFEAVEKEYRLLKLECINEISDAASLRFMLDRVLIAIDENMDKWKIDADSGKWLWYDSKHDQWLERERPGKVTGQEDIEYRVAFIPPASPLPPAVKRQEAAGPKMMLCPGCGAAVRASAKFCPFCGGNFITNKKSCSACGSEIKLTAKYCVSCGSSQKQNTKGGVE